MIMYSALIVAAGSGTRMDLDYNKVFYKIKNKTIIEYSVEFFRADKDCEEIVIVVAEDDKAKMKELFPSIKLVIGGATRQESVLNGLSVIESEYVMIHDGARPNLKRYFIQEVKNKMKELDAAILCYKVQDSVMTETDDRINHYLDRDEICFVQTPQAFKKELILIAHRQADKSNHKYLDDASVYMHELNKDVFLVYGDNTNIKATTRSDLEILEVLLW